MSLEQIDEMYQEVMPINSYQFRRRLAEEGRLGVDKIEEKVVEEA